MGEIVLDGIHLCKRDTAHQYLKEMLDFPEYYGCNLDALYDCLTDYPATEIEIKLPKDQTFYFKRVLRVFKDATKRNEKLTLIMISIDEGL